MTQLFKSSIKTIIYVKLDDYNWQLTDRGEYDDGDDDADAAAADDDDDDGDDDDHHYDDSDNGELNPSSPNVNWQILLTELLAFLIVLVERSCLNIKAVHLW